MKYLISVLIVVVVTIVAITTFLTVNNLRNCGDTPNNLQGCEQADVIIAVSGGDTGARTQAAIDLYQQGWGKKLLFSGAALDKSGPSNAEVMRAQATAQGVPEDDIFIEHTSETTSENASHTVDILKRENVASAILVTSSYHQKRTLLEFQSRAPDISFRSFPSKGDRQWSIWWWTTPHGWYLAVSEMIKIVVFYFGGSR